MFDHSSNSSEESESDSDNCKSSFKLLINCLLLDDDDDVAVVEDVDGAEEEGNAFSENRSEGIEGDADFFWTGGAFCCFFFFS